MNDVQALPGKSLDAVDLAILRALASDGRKPIAQIAEDVGLTETPCARRVRQLEAAGVIRGYTATIDPRAVDLGVSVLVFVELKEEFDAAFAAFTNAVEGIDAVQSCYFVAGEMDFVLLLRLADIGEMETFAREQLGSLDMVRNFHSVVCIREVFDRPSLRF